MLMPQMILLTFTLVATWYEESTPYGIQESSMTSLSNNQVFFHTNTGGLFSTRFIPLYIGYGITSLFVCVCVCERERDPF